MRSEALKKAQQKYKRSLPFYMQVAQQQAQKRYRQSEKGKATHRQTQQRYLQTRHGKKTHHIAQWRWYMKNRAKYNPAGFRRFMELVKSQGKLVEKRDKPVYTEVWCWQGDHYLLFSDIPDVLMTYEGCTCL